MPLSGSQIACLENGQLVVRPDAVRVKWSFDDLISSDNHSLRLTFSASLRALPDAAERKMFAETFLAQSALVSVDQLMKHFEGALRAAAASACQVKSAADFVKGGTPVLEPLRSAANRVAFSAGLEVLPPFEIAVQSPTLEQQRLEKMHRDLAEQRAAGQVEHFQRAADLLRQFESVRQSGAGLTPGQILQQINPSDQATLLQTLLLAAAKEKPTTAIYAVAGETLLTINPQGAAPKVDQVALPTTLGPLRSVQTSAAGLLVGARSGVIRMDLGVPDAPEVYRDPAVTSQLGFSSAVLWHDEIWACHSESGIIAWKLNEPGQPICALRPVDLNGAAPRNLRVIDESMLAFSSQNRLMLLVRKNSDETPPVLVRSIEPPAASEVVAILPHLPHVTIVLGDGRLQLRQALSFELVREQRPSGVITAAGLLPWLSSTRILLATDDGPIMCVGWDDELITQYQSPYVSPRALAAGADLIAALTSDRQRIVLWQTHNPRQPLTEIFIPPLARHRAADIEI